jgi:hypothetical protein
VTEQLNQITLGEAALIAGVIGMVFAVLRKVLPALRKAMRLIDDVMGVPESAPGKGDAQPGVLERVSSLESDVSKIADATAATVVQVHPNGGGSLRDQIDTMTRNQAELKRMIEERLPKRDDDEPIHHP